MSLPLCICSFWKAATDEQSYVGLKAALIYNTNHGAFTVIPCPHKPPCAPPSEDKFDSLLDRLSRDNVIFANRPSRSSRPSVNNHKSHSSHSSQS